MAVELQQYWLPSIKGEGWAKIVIGSDGFFAAVSDYGNYAFWWTHIGTRTFKEFLLGCDADYVRRKLDSSRHFDEDATVANIHKEIIRLRRKGKLRKSNARWLWDEAEGMSNEVELYAYIEENGSEFDEPPYDAAVYGPDCQVVAFCEHILPRLKEELRKEISDGNQGASPPSV